MSTTNADSTHPLVLELIKTTMPLMVVLAGAFSAYELVDRHAQKMSEREQLLKETEFEAKNVFRVLEKYLQQQPYPELARFQMLGFISETTHNEDLRKWASKQRDQHLDSINEFQELAHKVALERLEFERQKSNAQRQEQQQKLLFKQNETKRLHDLRSELTKLRDKLGSKRREVTRKLGIMKTAQIAREKADKGVEIAEALPARQHSIADVALKTLEQIRDDREEEFLKAQDNYERANGELTILEHNLKYVESDLARIGKQAVDPSKPK